MYAVRLPSIAFDQTFAMKLVLPKLRDEAEFNAMFLDEARIAAAVRHPNVVQVIEMGTHRGASYLVMEYLRGQSLSALRRKARGREAPVPMRAALQILAAAARGLHAAHETADAEGKPMHIVHRDVSPQNIFVGYDGMVKIVDFGVAAARGKLVETQTGQIKGKFQYLSPEQVRRTREPDRRADVWALGVVAWELFSQRALFRGADDASTLFNVVSADIPHVEDVPASVDALIRRCLNREVVERPASAAEVADELERIARSIEGEDVTALMSSWFAEQRQVDAAALTAPSEVVTVASPVAAATTAPTRYRRRWPFAALALLGVGAIAVAVVLGVSESEPAAASEPVPEAASPPRMDPPSMDPSSMDPPSMDLIVATMSLEPTAESEMETDTEATEAEPQRMRSRLRSMRASMEAPTMTEMEAPLTEMHTAPTGFGNPYAR